ncbi:MAG: DUF58 domain-containing protein [Paracoccaceae bacterium]|nr:DUF58 domain-containing protein [Paracoccaceae bacterium]
MITNGRIPTHPVALRQSAHALADPLPSLLAAAHRLAQGVAAGAHGRRRVGRGDEFWQYRPALPGDPLRQIDWRRSARSDNQFVAQREWQAAQSVFLWADPRASMQFSGAPNRPEKAHRAQTLALALALVLLRGGERVGLCSGPTPLAASCGRGQAEALGHGLLAATTGPAHTAPLPQLSAVSNRGWVVLLSDFLDDLAPFERATSAAAARGVQGVIIQVLDPIEESFPFDGHVLFESMDGITAFDTPEAADLQIRYKQRLAARKDALTDLARRLGWQFSAHSTGASALSALLWAYGAMSVGR